MGLTRTLSTISSSEHLSPIGQQSSRSYMSRTSSEYSLVCFKFSNFFFFFIKKLGKVVFLKFLSPDAPEAALQLLLVLIEDPVCTEKTIFNFAVEELTNSHKLMILFNTKSLTWPRRAPAWRLWPASPRRRTSHCRFHHHFLNSFRPQIIIGRGKGTRAESHLFGTPWLAHNEFKIYQV